MSSQPCPNKVTNRVPDNARADEKAIENAKTGKVTAVVTVMHIFGETNRNSYNVYAKICAKKANQV
jgi:hypothetical protein